MTKIKIHILKIEKWNQDLEKQTIINKDEINESENIEPINDKIINTKSALLS